MSPREKLKGAKELERARNRFRRFREGNRPARKALPKGLWRLAMRLGRKYGISRTVKNLGLNYGMLRDRIEAEGVGQLGKGAFVEVKPGGPMNLGGSLVEFEKADGAKLRIYLASGEKLDISALTAGFWSNRE